MSTNRPNASIWDDDEGEAQLRPTMRNNAHLFDDEPAVSSLSAASAASAAAAVAGYTASSAAEANAASALSAPSAYSVGSASSAFSARSAGSAHSAVSASSAAVPSAASAAAPEAAGAVVSAPTPDSAGSAPLTAHSGTTADAAPSAGSARSGAPSAASAPAMPPSQAPKSAPSAPVNGPILGATPSVHVPASSLANNGVPAMLANTPPAAGRRYTNAENAHTSGTFDSAARRATATTAATSATAATGASALTAASAAAASITAQSPASAASANIPEPANVAKPAVSSAASSDAAGSADSASGTQNVATSTEPASAASAGTTNPQAGAVRRRSLFTAVPQPVPVDEDSDDETIQVPVVREDLIPDSFSAASAFSASAASASATSAAESASAAETTSAAETSSSVSAVSSPSSLEHSSTAPSPASAASTPISATSAPAGAMSSSASDDVAPAPARESTPQESTPRKSATQKAAIQESAVQTNQEAADSVQELADAQEVEAAATPLPTDFDAPSAISIPTPPHTVSSALSAESTFSIDSAVSAASAASSAGITLPAPATPAPAVPLTPAQSVPVTTATSATDTDSEANELSEPTPAADVPEPPAPPAPEQPEATGAGTDLADDEVVASDNTETTIMDAADMELEEVVKPVVTSTSPVGVERLDHLATADSADLAPVTPSPSSAIFASTRTAAFTDSANQSDAGDEVDDDVLLAGSTVVGKPASRAAAHWGGTLLALVLFPIAWFLMHTAANALTGALADGWPKVFSTAGVIELGMAAVLLIVVMATATRSSLGTFVTGITTLLIGLPFVVVPSVTKQYLGDFLANMALQSRFGRILSEAVLNDGVSGRLVIIGLFLIMLGVVSHSTRRAGRRERLVMDRANTKK